MLVNGVAKLSAQKKQDLIQMDVASRVKSANNVSPSHALIADDVIKRPLPTAQNIRH
jgi:hypothetical protein